MVIKYKIKLVIKNLITDMEESFLKSFSSELEENDVLYGNYHTLIKSCSLMVLFDDQIATYMSQNNVMLEELQVQSYEIYPDMDGIELKFIQDEHQISLHPEIQCYVFPKEQVLEAPNGILHGTAYDDVTIIWTFEDAEYAHYLISAPMDSTQELHEEIVAQVPIGVTVYRESNLSPDTVYTRRLVRILGTEVSAPSTPVSVRTETRKPEEDLRTISFPAAPIHTYNNDALVDVSERMEAFQSGIGYNKDLKISKTMSDSYYEKFKAQLTVIGDRVEREKRHEQVGFHYRVCCDAIQTIEEQEGEIAFQLNAYPKERIVASQYMWATQPVPVRVKVEADVDMYFDSTVQTNTNTVTNTTYPKANPMNFLFILDMSSSMLLRPSENVSGVIHDKTWENMSSNSRINIAIRAIKRTAKTILKMTYTQGNIEKHCDARISLICYATSAKKIVFPDNKAWIRAKDYLAANGNDWEKAIDDAYSKFVAVLDSLKITGNTDNKNAGVNRYNAVVQGTKLGNYTNWYDALVKAKSRMDNVTSNNTHKAIFMFSDGAANMTANGTFCPKRTSTTNIDSVIDGLKSIGSQIRSSDVKDVWCITTFDGSHDVHDGSYTYTPSDISKMTNAILCGEGSCLHPSNTSYTDNDIAELYNHALEQFSVGKTTVDITEEVVASGTVAATVHIVSDTYVFEVSDTYSEHGVYNLVDFNPEERRAIITTATYEKKLDELPSIYDMIFAKVEQTREWQNGLRGASHPNETGIVIKNVTIYDSYGYADQESISGMSFSEWEYGKNGTLNIYGKMKNAKDDTYSNDCYYATQNSYLYVDGYAESMIFDGSRFVDAILNGNSNPSVILASASEDVAQYMFCRKNRTIPYTGPTGNIHTALFLVEKGEDIEISGVTLSMLNQWAILEPAQMPITANLLKSYVSPFLNYRFNLEDPDARVPFYQILPQCKEHSPYEYEIVMSIYYARNINIGTDTSIPSYGDAPLPGGSCLTKTWDNELLDNFLWMYASPMKKDVSFHAEYPSKDMEPFYGLVNGRYREDRQDGKQDLRVKLPQFNLPTSVLETHSNTIRISIDVLEYVPDTALVSYRFDHPYNGNNCLTQVNGDYVVFFSDSITYKDVTYQDILNTIETKDLVLTDQKAKQFLFEIPKTGSDKHSSYHLEVITDNANVIPLHYPSDIRFPEGVDKTDVIVTFKSVINATSKWSPKIHEGYYYLNQEEYFLASEFNVAADFVKETISSYDKQIGFVSIETTMTHPALPTVDYSAIKMTKSELIQDETNFDYSESMVGVILRPLIDGELYKEYPVCYYESGVLYFQNELTENGVLTVSYSMSDGSNQPLNGMEVRSYNSSAGTWNPWVPFSNNTVPGVPLSAGYQVRFLMSASVQNSDYTYEDYCCCYLDWKEDMDVSLSTNVSIISDHISTTHTELNGTFVSRILDFGCPSGLSLTLETSQNEVVLGYVAMSNVKEDLQEGHIVWMPMQAASIQSQYRYYRYKIEILHDQRVFYLHKVIHTKKTSAVYPVIHTILMSGKYTKAKETTSFIEVKSYEIPMDAKSHTVVPKVIDLLKDSINNKGYQLSEIDKLVIKNSNPYAKTIYDSALTSEHPSQEVLEHSISVSSLEEKYVFQNVNTPYLYVNDAHCIELDGIPTMFSPICVEDFSGCPWTYLEATEFEQVEEFVVHEEVLLSLRYASAVELSISLDGHNVSYERKGEQIRLSQPVSGTIVARYRVNHSYLVGVDAQKQKTTIYLYTKDDSYPDKMKVYYETATQGMFMDLSHLSMNPIYRTAYDGFIYLSDTYQPPVSLRIHGAIPRMVHGGWDVIDLNIEVLDADENPCPNEYVTIDCQNGILKTEDNRTDINGIVHCLYTAPSLAGTDTVQAKVKDIMTAVTIVID